MSLVILDGCANPTLARAIVAAMGESLGRCEVQRFPDGEIHVQLRQTVRGCDVYLVQPTAPPVEEHLFVLLLLADACRRAGASRVTAVVPYLGYARHDRRASGREPVAARLVADLMGAAGVERLVAVDLHSAALEGVFSMPLEHLSAVGALADAVRTHVTQDSVLVAPDLGAVKLVDRYARLLSLPVAIVHKVRHGAERVAVRRITGDVRDRRPILVDDMISTGVTIEAAADALLEAGAASDMMLMASHGLFVGAASQRLGRLPIRRVLVTDSVGVPKLSPPLRREVVGLGELLGAAIERLHEGRSLEDLLVHE